MTARWLLLVALGALSVALAAKDKPKAPAFPVPVEARASTETTLQASFANASASGLDWTLAPAAFKASLAAEALVPWSPDADSGLVFDLDAKGKLEPLDPKGAGVLLAFTRAQGTLWAGATQTWKPDLGPLSATLTATVQGGGRFDALLDADSAYLPQGADPVAFWTRLGPRWRGELDLALKLSPLKLEGQAWALGGKDAEVAWNRAWPDLVAFEARGKATLKVLDLGSFEARVGAGARYQRSLDLFGDAASLREDALVELAWGKGLGLEAVPWSLDDGTPSWRASLQAGGAVKLGFEAAGQWTWPLGFSVAATTKQEF